MNLIPINSSTINNEVKQTVNARELHQFLEVGKVFGAWITERIEQFGFAENQDFVVYSETGKNPSGGRPTKEYAVTLDMAKELSMVERNEKGKQARQYFIECEKKTQQLPADPVLAQLQILTNMRQDVINHDQRLTALEAKVITRDESYYTAAGFCSHRGIKADRSAMIMIGRLAAGYSKQYGLPIGKVHDSRYGSVNEYRVDALEYAVRFNVEVTT